MTPAARLSGAIDLLCAIQNAPHRPADAVANNFFRERRYIGGGDRRAISTLAWDVLRAWRRLHWHLRADLRYRHEDVSPRLLCAAMLHFVGQPLSSIQSLFSGERYAPAPLSEREMVMLEALEGQDISSEKQPLPVRLEYPDWLHPYLVEDFGDRLEEEMRALTGAPSLDLRVNLLKGTREEALRRLRREGFQGEPTALSPWGIRLEGRQPVTAAALFREGLVEIQDEGSQLIAAAVDARPGQRLLDYCAGAAGKTLALAMTMENKGQIVACDVSRVRLDGATKRLRRADVHNVTRHLLSEGDKWAKRREGQFDTVLVDAPCSGTGTWRRNPDARLRLTEEDIKELCAKQAAILDIAARLVRPGGKLVYATCSLLGAENGKQIEAFLKRQEAYTLLPAEKRSILLPEELRQEALFSLTPHGFGTDGFFVAAMEKMSQG
ncbi:RsmB/NOP family class I SAM-dependent RNA methyltransferase [Bombella apis]|uniref:RsmB/NOP family class I SAM-dependent RNA methyltransferase n=1 Tax=Bombella apis TaxID=1785988 RepID=A0ABR9MNM2_9PROT|nr:RsmB/NOP family class I SAM-dependent RNA methyltransferase [Bombella apis]MBE1723119.1 RsmB/NOP family class I SAM-dependent RNA methyltransferase [Bombella apis]MBR9730926.1 RsmB/NOP family class I SAM-dependent RNA methyltransferase [Bombella apis]